MAYDLSLQNIPVWLLSLEMSVPSLLERLFCHAMNVDNYSLLSGQMKMDAGIQRKYLQFKDMMQDSSLLITEGLGKSWGEVNELIENVGEKPKVIIVDYIQNIAFRSGDTREIINDYIRRFRNLAIKHEFAGVLCSQINRSAEEHKDNKPVLSQLKETGFLEESADVVMLLYWQAFYDKVDNETSTYKIIIAKNRNGRTGEESLFYTPKFYRFTEDRILPEPKQVPIVGEEVRRAVDLFGGTIVED
jgi:replicative DNA helicase